MLCQPCARVNNFELLVFEKGSNNYSMIIYRGNQVYLCVKLCQKMAPYFLTTQMAAGGKAGSS